MKNIKFIHVLLIVIHCLFAQQAFATNVINATAPVPGPTYSGAYRVGDVFSITYSATFSLIDGTQTQLKLSYNSATLELVDQNVPNTTGVFSLPSVTNSGPIRTCTYLTPIYTTANAYSGATTFELQFRVIGGDCSIPSNGITMELATLTPPSAYSDIVSQVTPISYNNANATPSIDVALISGSPGIGTALYRIKTVGVTGSLPWFEGVYFSMPAGVSITGVYNSLGSPVSFAPNGYTGIYSFAMPCFPPGTVQTMHWDRDVTGPVLQYHYVLVNFTGATPCTGNMCASFVNETICPSSYGIYQSVSAPLISFNACGWSPGPDEGSIPVTGGSLYFKKSFQTNFPLQYFCAPNNCKQHEYIIRVDNISPNPVTGFNVEDLLGNISTSAGPSAITVTGIEAALTSIPPTTSGSITISPTSTLSTPLATSIGLNTGYQPLYNPSGTGADPDELWPSTSNASWSIMNPTGTIPAFTTLWIKIKHKLNTCPTPLTDPYTNKANITAINASGVSQTVQVTKTTTVNDAFLPNITVSKTVRRVGDIAYVSNTTAAPGEMVEFKITIRNYGLGTGTVKITDNMSNTSSTCAATDVLTNYTAFTATDNTSGAAVYTSADLAAIVAALGITSSAAFSNTGIAITIQGASSCDAVSELVITYKAKLPIAPCCNSTFTNHVVVMDYSNPSIIWGAGNAVVHVDRFKYIELKLEATCDTTGEWRTTIIDAKPGQTIYYRASIRNNNNVPLTGLRMMVQLPSGGTNITTHSSAVPVALNSFTTTGGGFATPTGVYRTCTGCSSGTYGAAGPVSFPLNAVSNEWLGAGGFTPLSPAGLAIYAYDPAYMLGYTPGANEYVVRFNVIAPSAGTGNLFNTAMGVGVESGTLCPFVASTNLRMRIEPLSACDSGYVDSCICTITGDSVICEGESTTLSGCSGGTWSSGNTYVATVGSLSGNVIGAHAGTAIITFTSDEGCMEMFEITVQPALHLTIVGTTVICVGTYTTLTDSITSGGTWSSANPAIATVGSATGIVVGISPGIATISYAFFGPCGIVVTTVNVTVYSSVAPISGPSVVCLDDVMTLTDPTICGEWSSSDGTIASVNSSTGVVVGETIGTATITYTNCDGCWTTKTVSVIPCIGTDSCTCTITGDSVICIGESTTLSSCPGGIWTSGNTLIATVGSASGVVIGTGAGTVVITYSTPSGCVYTFTVHVLSPITISVITGTTVICVGGTATLYDSTAGGVWSSGNTTVATIGATTGVWMGISPGVAMITYTWYAPCGVTYTTMNVTVTAMVAPISGPNSVCVGSNITETDATACGTWSSSNTAVGTVNATTGVVHGVSQGTMTLTYTSCSGCVVTKTISVNANPVLSGPVSLCAGTSLLLGDDTASCQYWTSSNPSVATVGYSNGLVHGESAGTATITVMNCSGCIATTVVSVYPTPTTIAGTTTLCVGFTTALSNASSGGTWSSNNTSVATIGATTGIVTGISAGTARITYMLATGCYTTATVTISSSASPITGTLFTCNGGTLTLSSSSPGGAWSSGNTAVATISPTTGVLTATAAGTTVITYTVSGCSSTAVATVGAMPASITGTTTLCVGATTTLSSATSGCTWSSSTPAVATISSTGVVTGVSIGTTMISYINAVGCYRTAAVTVSSGPSPISGTLTVCAGSVTALMDSTPGGVWTSGTTAKATIGSATGIATGIAAGTSIISYTVGSCRSTAVLTINAGLATIGGTATSVCVGQTVTFTHATSGGTWTSSNTGLATVGATTGIVSGISAGMATITYSTNPTCYKTKPITISGGAGSIAGNLLVCEGMTTTLTPPGTGSGWSSSNPAVGVIGATNGVVTGVSAGTTTITYTGTASSGSCISTTVVSVQTMPAAITGATTVCQGSTTLMSSATSGGTWASNNLSKATVGSTTGLVTGVSATAPSSATISYAMANGCYRTALVTVITIPASSAIGPNVTMTTGNTYTLTATYPGGTWASSNTSVATVAPTTGIVSVAGIGSTTFTYSNTNTCGTRNNTRVYGVASRQGQPSVLPDDAVSFNVYPNPASGVITIESPATGMFSIYTIDGKMVSSYDIIQPTSTLTLPAHLAAGVYICRFNGNDGYSKEVRLVYKP